MRVSLREQVRFASFVEAEANDAVPSVESLGLDPSIYIGVIPAEAGRFGRVNGNGRVYPLTAIKEHERVVREGRRAAEARDEPVGAMDGHPYHQEDRNLAASIVGGKTEIEADGSALVRADFAMLATRFGEDIMTTWRAGYRRGISSRGTGRLVEHVIDEESPYFAMNPDFAGETVNLVEDFQLDGYDFVWLPSAGTHADRPSEAVREALQRIQEAIEPKTPIVSESEEPMKLSDVETWAQLIEHAPKLAEEGSALVRADTLTQTEEALASANARVEAAEEALAEARKATADAQVESAGKDAAMQELTERMNVFEAEVARASLRVEVVEMLETHCAGRGGCGTLIRAQVLEDFDKNRVDSLEAAKAETDRKIAIAEASPKAAKAATKPFKPAIVESVSADDAADNSPAARLRALQAK